MAEGAGSAGDSAARPLLGGGERLREATERAGGGGPTWHPRTVEQARALLAPQAANVAETVGRLPESLRGPHVIFEATLRPNYVASSHFPTHLLRAADLYTVGTRQATGVLETPTRRVEGEPTKTLLLAGAPERLDDLADFLSRAPIARELTRVWDDVREFDSMRAPDASVIVQGADGDFADGEVVTWEAVLSRIGRTEAERETWSRDVFDKWVALVESLGGEVASDFRRSVAGLTFVPVALTVDRVAEAAAFNVLRAIRPMPPLQAAPRGTPRATPRVVAPPSPAAMALSDARLAVFDGGVDPANAFVAPFVTLHPLAPARAIRDVRAHGEHVTHALLYGYSPAGGTLEPPPAYVDHYKIWPPPPHSTVESGWYWVLDQVVDAVVRDGHRLVNLSLGPRRAVNPHGEPDRWTATLDALAAEHGVLFVVAAGNEGRAPNARIQVPGDMVNGLTVGACDSRDPARAVSRCPYSNPGPGRAGQRVQPVGTAFGGVEGVEPFLALGPDGRLAELEGTSYATPLVTRGLAELVGVLGERATPETLRAFAAHFATGRRAAGNGERHVGYGRLPETYGNVWECASHEVTTVYQDAMRRGELAAFRLPLPDGLPPDLRIEVQFTFAFTAPVDPADVSDYTAAGFELTFRPHERRRMLYDTSTTPPTSLGEVDTEVDRDRIVEAYRQGPRSLSALPLADAGGRRARGEGELRRAGKWETLIRRRFRRAAGQLYMPRIDVEFFARANGVLLDPADVATPQPFTLIVTLRAPSGVPLYERARAAFPQLAALRADVEAEIVASARADAAAPSVTATAGG